MQTRRVVLALLIVCSLAGNLQTRQVRDPTGRSTASQPKIGTAAITGTVVAVSSGQPLIDASVSVSGASLPEGRSTTTDAEGRFTLEGLVEGLYTVSASRSGFLTVIHGQRRVGA